MSALERDEGILAPSVLDLRYSLPTDVKPLARRGGHPGSAPSPLGCRGYGYVNICSAVPACFVRALEVAGGQVQPGSDAALISTVPGGFIVRPSLLLSLFVPMNP